MIKLTVYRSSTGFTRAFKLAGHANLAPHGKDIVCAAVSGLAQSIIGSLQEIVVIEPSYILETGKIYCEIAEKDLNEKQKIQADALMRAVEIGARQIQASYGDSYLTVVVDLEDKQGGSK